MGYLFEGKMEKIRSLHLNGAGVSTDTRRLDPGDIFFALKGKQFNGNRFIREALEKGAALAVADDPEFAEESDRVMLVEDSLKTLQDLARDYRHELEIPVIGITGSNGKTTTKELVHEVLKKKFRVQATQGNLNNHIGVPLTVLGLSKETEIAVVEMGANHVGEIAQLCSIAMPDHGLITNIGKAHLEGFGGYSGVIKAKSELYSHLRKDYGRVFVNSRDALLMRLSEGIRRTTYGPGGIVDAEVIPRNQHISIRWTSGPGSDTTTDVELSGTYNLQNILAAACTGLFFEVPWKDIASALSAYKARNNRSEIRKTESNTLLLDAYNANPSSMELSLRNFQGLEGNRKWAILGDMLELGADAEEEHRKILELARDMKFKQLLLVGPVFCDIAGSQDLSFQKVEDCAEWLEKNKPEDAFILLKGSRGIRIEYLVEYL